ncbi:hypothetical protein N1851_005246 [Merluccius polli]|uniref:Uncharacterized protein n=1 Tax=Merluccius polli TaxID=89951 RepID=A0AA47N7P4_MERPO|nr:hypothetical protein N1851_005246 [Merluccius polli]
MDGREVNEGCSSPENNNLNGSSSYTDTVTMETAEQSDTAAPQDCEVELTTDDSREQETHVNPNDEDEQVCAETNSSDATRENLFDLLPEPPTDAVKPDDDEANYLCTDTTFKDSSCPVTGHDELNRNESIASSVSDTLSSADSVYENETHRKRQDTQEQDLEPKLMEDVPPSPKDDDDDVHLTTEKEEDPMIQNIPFQAPTGDAEESILEHYIREEVMSDVSNESYHDLDADECLRVKIAVASSDSDTDEKWRTIFSSSINREDDDSYLDSLQLSAQELFVQKAKLSDGEEEDDVQIEETPVEVGPEDEVLEQPIDIVSFSSPLQEVTYNPLSLPGLSKISEDSENGKEASNRSHTHTHQQHFPPLSSDATKKLPKDFCVIQETKSENVSTEHVDFQVARKQWLEMEEQSKKQIVSPTAKTPSLHGSHSFMYMPVRNVERPQRKENSLENLSLVGDYPLTQFSPCSEDSGLDDLSYRSPYDDPETLVERQICAVMEREDHVRKGRGFSKMGKSTDCAPSRSIPRSTCTPLTPSFIITSSPSKGPLSHEVAANNIIILEPGDEFSTGPSHTPWDQAGEWRSEEGNSNLIILETSNLIIRSASEFCLSKVCEPQEKTFLNNPFFKLRSRSSMSLVDEEIRVVKQREEELRKERASVYGKDRFGTSIMSPNHMDSLKFNNTVDVPEKCKSSPSSPMKTAYRMDRAVLSCDHRFPEVYSRERRKSAMALRWEAGEFAGEFPKND